MARQSERTTFRNTQNERYNNVLPEYLRKFSLITLTDVWKITDTNEGPKGKKQTPYFNFNIELIDNPYLAYYKLYYPDEEWSNAKKSYLDEFLKIYDKQKENYRYIYNRLYNSIKSVESYGHSVSEIKDLQTDWRLIVGLGGESVLETSISLHPLYGFPYIPGSAVKGVARASAILLDEQLSNINIRFIEKFIDNNKSDKLAVDNKDMELKNLLSYIDDNKNLMCPNDEEIQILKNHKESLFIIREIFGNQEQSGEVIFYDAFPFKELPKLKVDIMNNHFNEYYNKNDVYPADNQDPLPIYFITVAEGQIFSFFLSSKNATFLEKAGLWLKDGLKDLGAGGKTNAGYGYFIPIKAAPANEEKSKYTIAVITDLSKKPYKANLIEDNTDFMLTGLNNPSLLGLEIGSKIYVDLRVEKNTKKIQSGKFIKKA